MAKNKVFHIDGHQDAPENVPLTVDNTLFTVDDTNITVDATVIDNYPYVLRVITRVEAPNVKVIFKNEFTKEASDIEIMHQRYNREHIEIYFDFPFQEGDSFEIKIINLDEPDPRRNLMWRGKGYATMQDDLENYRLITKNNDDIIIMD